MKNRESIIKRIIDGCLFWIVPLSFILMTIIEIIYGCAIVGNKDASLGGFFVIEGWTLIFLIATMIYIIAVKKVRYRIFTVIVNGLIIIALLNSIYFYALPQAFNNVSPYWYPVLSDFNGLWFTTNKMMLNTYLDPSIDKSLEKFIVYQSSVDINGSLISSVILICGLGVTAIVYNYLRKSKNIKES